MGKFSAEGARCWRDLRDQRANQMPKCSPCPVRMMSCVIFWLPPSTQSTNYHILLCAVLRCQSQLTMCFFEAVFALAAEASWFTTSAFVITRASRVASSKQQATHTRRCTACLAAASLRCVCLHSRCCARPYACCCQCSFDFLWTPASLWGQRRCILQACAGNGHPETGPRARCV